MTEIKQIMHDIMVAFKKSGIEERHQLIGILEMVKALILQGAFSNFDEIARKEYVG